jgi:hypothetical protein
MIRVISKSIKIMDDDYQTRRGGNGNKNPKDTEKAKATETKRA